MNFIVLKKRTIILFLLACITIGSVSVWLYLDRSAVETFTQQPADKVREVHLVTGEFKATLPDGKEIEAYRWDPGTIFVEKDEKVRLIIYGVNGMEHPFHIEGTTIKGTVKKGEETTIPLEFTKEGVYRLICEVHPDKDHNGPMIAYIIVD
jgi:heme/copper-type cytochrome/quinol oxidase subunit 2